MSPYTSDYTEIDPSPMATQAIKFLAEQEESYVLHQTRAAASIQNFFDRDLQDNPSARHSLVYDA